MSMYVASLVLLGLFLFSVITWLVLHFRPHPLSLTPGEELSTENLDVDDWRLRYHRSGRGPVLLCLHGIGANLYCWRWIAPLLRPWFTLVLIDLPGFGGSSMPTGLTYGLDEQVERLTRLLDQLKIKQAYVVGNSMGGNLALWLTKLHPDRVLGCAVIAPATSRKLVPVSLRRVAWAAPSLSRLLTRTAMEWAHRRTVSRPDRVDRARVEETFRVYGGQAEAVRSFLMATDAIRDVRLPRALETIDRPVLILWGSRDRLVRRQVIDELERVLPSAESYVHIGGGHHLQEDEPEWVAEKIQAFFRVGRD